jgi:hypothetical protein
METMAAAVSTAALMGDELIGIKILVLVVILSHVPDDDPAAIVVSASGTATVDEHGVDDGIVTILWWG